MAIERKQVFWGGALLLAGLWAVGRLVEEQQTLPRCEVANREVKSSVFMVDGEPNAGFELTVDVMNPGPSKALFRIVATLSTSQGEFRRAQNLELAPGVTQTLKYGFHEPTINATNIQGRVSCDAVRGG